MFYKRAIKLCLSLRFRNGITKLTRQQQDHAERQEVRVMGHETDVHREKAGHRPLHGVVEQRVYVVAQSFGHAGGTWVKTK